MAGTELHLDPVPGSVPAARRWLREALEFNSDYDVQVACLLLTELATNALLHARTAMVVRATDTGDVLRVEVLDVGAASVTRPADPGIAPEDDESGRGLQIVDMLADRWGLAPTRDGDGTTAWFELYRTQSSSLAARGDESA